MKITFSGEIKEFKASKSVSNDKIRRLVILTEDKAANDLINFEAETTYKIIIDEND